MELCEIPVWRRCVATLRDNGCELLPPLHGSIDSPDWATSALFWAILYWATCMCQNGERESNGEHGGGGEMGLKVGEATGGKREHRTYGIE